MTELAASNSVKNFWMAGYRDSSYSQAPFTCDWRWSKGDSGEDTLFSYFNWDEKYPPSGDPRVMYGKVTPSEYGKWRAAGVSTTNNALVCEYKRR